MKNHNLSNIKPADRVIMPKSELEIVQHHGIYAGRDHLGQHWFLENNWQNGVQFVTSSKFLKDTSSDRIKIEPFLGNQTERTAALIKAKNKVGEKYNLFLYNCEHYCNEVQYGKAKSIQILMAALLGVIAVLAIRTSRD